MKNAVDRWVSAALLFASLTAGSWAAADNTTVAQALFDEARRLMKQGQYPSACAKFAESYRLEPAGGTLMNLASCHARQGKTATAWAEFRDALSQATKDQREERIQEVKKRIAELEPHLSRLRVAVADAVPANAEVRLDDTVLGRAAWGMPIPVDPGPHVLRVSAPGYAPWTTSVSVAEESTSEIVVPTLRRLDAPQAQPPLPSSAPAAPHPSNPVNWTPYALAGVGVIGVGVGSYFGVVALTRKHDSEAECSPAGCSQRGADQLRSANNAAWVSNIGIGVGVTAWAVATYLWVRTPKAATPSSAMRVAPRVGAGNFGMDVGGTW